MNDNKIPYIAFEAEMARHEREKLRLVKALVVAIALIFISNIGWLFFFNQFDYAIDTVTQELDSGNADSVAIGLGLSCSCFLVGATTDGVETALAVWMEASIRG